jgi:hypothetical protein
MIKLTENNQPFSWDEDCEAAFQSLKQRIISAPILAYSLTTEKFILDTNVCDQSIDAVLYQVQDGKETVIAYASKSLSRSE